MKYHSMFNEINKKFVLQGHNVQIIYKKYRKEIGQKVSIKIRTA